MLILGILVILVGAGLTWGSLAKRRGADELRGVERRQAGELASLVREIGSEVGQGAFREQVELVGEVECEAPLRSPLDERPCLHYTLTVRREYEETYTDRDSQGREQRRTRRSSETVSQEHESAVFRVRDESGALPVYPEGARYDGLVTSVDRFEPGEANASSLGGIVLSVASQLTGGRRTLGYKYQERVFPLDRRVTVIGQVSDEMGEVAIRKGDGPLVIATRTREEMVGSAQKAARVLRVTGLIALVGGALLVVFGVL